MTSVRLVGKNLHVSIPLGGDNLIKARGIPQRSWLKSKRVWSCRPSIANMDYIATAWPGAQWDAASRALHEKRREAAVARERVARGDVDLTGVTADLKRGLFKGRRPWGHQLTALALGRDMDVFAYLMDQGTGKTRVLLDDAAHNYRRGRTNGLLVLSPNSVKTNWISDDNDPEEPDAVDAWLPDDVRRIKGVWISDPNAAQKRAWEEFMDQVSSGYDGLMILAANYEAVNTERAFKQFEHFVKGRDTMIAADESTRLGQPGSGRTRQSHKLRSHARLARIMSGTPIIKSPLKAYSQFGFLSEDILGFGSFYSFKARYSIMGGFQGRQVLKHVNLDELSEKIASCSYRVRKEDCLDLPPKVYQKRRVYMTAAQARAYSDMKERMLAEIDGRDVLATIQLTQLAKLQQITGGYVLHEDGSVIEVVAPEHNPKIIETLGIVDEAGESRVVIWCHFREEIAALARVLRAEGYLVGEFHGGVPEKDRLQVRRDFKKGRYDVLIANKAAGGIGIDEFKVACVVVNFSRSFDTEAEVQGEDRTHRGGSEEFCDRVTYYDLVVPNTVDVKIVRTLRSNRAISDEVMRDGLREWI